MFIEDNCSSIINNSGIKIIREETKTLDYRYGIFCGACKISPKYYFAQSDGTRLSDSYYSIERLDDIHYVVSDLHFMYSLGFEEFVKLYGNEITEADFFHFKFHFGIVSVKDNKAELITPIVYNRIKLSNSKIAIVYGDESYGFNSKFNSKLGCINLDQNSDFYGLTIIPPVLDTLMDFNLEFKDYAHAYISDYDGYLSKNIDFEKYNEFIYLYISFKEKNIDYKSYRSSLGKAVSSLLLTKEEVIAKMHSDDSDAAIKKIGAKK